MISINKKEKDTMTCECHEIDYMSGLLPCAEGYRMKDGSDYVPGKCCQFKVNEKTMSMGQYFGVCKFIPGEPGTLFPEEVYQFLIRPLPTLEEGVESEALD